ncbi:MAG: N-acetyldiaminopimelate deacetylase [Bifidobacteriaceae bacterium]|jgi:N-acetyldiaminopimelate deacetylase|nr:N-acetyldiaminopimelate deacetylase [Bifidobacteriaceae bacterium]
MLNEKELIEIRRALHQIPEIALQEHETAMLLRDVIAKMPNNYLTVHIPSAFPTATLVYVRGSNPSRTIGFRADIDALPVKEQTGYEFASQHDGFMHACCHDFHMTVALGILSYFAENQPQNNMVFLFQPGEECASGAKLMYDDGVFTGKWLPDEFYALHAQPNLPAGAIATSVGTIFAGCVEFFIDIVGIGGHAAYPYKLKDPIVAGAEYVNLLQTVISRSINPVQGAVISVGKFHAGTSTNVIPDTLRIEGTARALTQETIDLLICRIKEVAHGIETAYGVKISLEFVQGGYMPVENDKELTKCFIDYMQSAPDVDFYETEPTMGAEDFGYIIQNIPGVMFWLGVNSDATLHSALIMPDESAIIKGVMAVKGFLGFRDSSPH